MNKCLTDEWGHLYCGKRGSLQLPEITRELHKLGYIVFLKCEHISCYNWIHTFIKNNWELWHNFLMYHIKMSICS